MEEKKSTLSPSSLASFLPDTCISLISPNAKPITLSPLNRILFSRSSPNHTNGDPNICINLDLTYQNNNLKGSSKSSHQQSYLHHRSPNTIKCPFSDDDEDDDDNDNDDDDDDEKVENEISFDYDKEFVNDDHKSKAQQQQHQMPHFSITSSPDKSEARVKNSVRQGLAKFTSDLASQMNHSKSCADQWYENEKNRSDTIVAKREMDLSEQLKSVSLSKKKFMERLESHLEAESHVLSQKIQKLETAAAAAKKKHQEEEEEKQRLEKEQQLEKEQLLKKVENEKMAAKMIEKVKDENEKMAAKMIEKVQQQQVKPASVTPPALMSEKERIYFEKCKEMINNFKAAQDHASSKQVIDSLSPAQRNARTSQRMRINKRVGQISADQKQVTAVSQDLILCLGESIKDKELFLYTLVTLCQKILEQCEKQISDLPSAAYPLASMWINICHANSYNASAGGNHLCSYQTLNEMLMGCLFLANPYLVPIYLKPSDFPASLVIEYHKGVGARVRAEPDGTIVQLEREDAYWSRLGGMMTFVAALQYLNWKEFIVKGRSPHPDYLAVPAPPMTTLKDGYLWLMRTCNQKGRKITATLIHSLLKSAGHGLFQLYPRSMKKYIDFLVQIYVKQYLPEASMAANVRLELFLQESIISKGYQPKPDPGSSF